MYPSASRVCDSRTEEVFERHSAVWQTSAKGPGHGAPKTRNWLEFLGNASTFKGIMGCGAVTVVAVCAELGFPGWDVNATLSG